MRFKPTNQKEENEFYPTPLEAIELSRPLLNKNINWWEPCAGDGRILDYFDNITYGSDIKPRRNDIIELDFLKANKPDNIQGVITNPPFTLGYELVKKCMLEWKIFALLLMRVEYMAAKKRHDMTLYMSHMHIVSDLIKFTTETGRIVNGNGTGRCAWMLFDPNKTTDEIILKYVKYKKNP